METIMPNWLMRRAELTPDRTAFETDRETVSFRTLFQMVTDIARELRSIGVRENDKVALLSESSLELVGFYHAISGAGAVSVPLNNRLSPEEAAWQLRDCGARWLICDQAFLPLAQMIVDRTPCTLLTMAEVHDQPKTSCGLNSAFDLNKPCTIIYTSGTTGHPKGVVLTYGNHWWSAAGSVLNLGLREDDKWLCCVPLFHVSGLSILMKNVIYGMTVVLSGKFNPHAANRQICANGVTMMSVVANMLRRMLDDAGAEGYPGTFRCMLLGGGPAPLPLLNRCKEKRIPVFQTYGLTETASQTATLPPEYMFTKIGSAGKPLFPAEIRIVTDGKAMRPNQPGEIIVRGLNVTPGYWGRRDATERAIKGGWLYTGDIGYLDQEGFLYILDRRQDLIISGGENVYPAEVESTLLGHPAVEEAGVIGVADETWGEVPYAFVVIKKGLVFSEKELLNYCRRRLAGYKLPVRIQPLERLPRNASRKLLRRKLVDFLPKTFAPRNDF
ncbi:o-succinylbenzoate--CoA ligase [Sporolactobacillus putidus]|nr:o-succinylbenzoate--CoA ligase [Sporolactobacillus putidus]